MHAADDLLLERRTALVRRMEWLKTQAESRQHSTVLKCVLSNQLTTPYQVAEKTVHQGVLESEFHPSATLSMCNEGGMPAGDSGCCNLVSASLETSLPVGQANRGGGERGRRLLTIKRWHLAEEPAGGISPKPHTAYHAPCRLVRHERES